MSLAIEHYGKGSPAKGLRRCDRQTWFKGSLHWGHQDWIVI